MLERRNIYFVIKLFSFKTPVKTTIFTETINHVPDFLWERMTEHNWEMEPAFNFLRMSGEQGVSGRGPRGILRDKSVSQCGCCYFQHPNPPFPGVTNSIVWAGRSFFPAGLLFWTRDVTHPGCSVLISGWLAGGCHSSLPGPWQEPHQLTRQRVGTLPGAWISASLFPTWTLTHHSQRATLFSGSTSAPVSESYDIVLSSEGGKKVMRILELSKIKAALSWA